MPLASVWALLSRKGTWVTILVALGVIFAGYALVNYVAVKSENMALKTEITQVERQRDQYKANNQANAQAIVTRNALIDALATVETKERVRTIEALKANPNWANQPIPADVLASLRD